MFLRPSHSIPMKALALLGVVFILATSAVCVYEFQADPCGVGGAPISLCAGGISHTLITSRITLATIFLVLGLILVLVALIHVRYAQHFVSVLHTLRLYGEKSRGHIHFLVLLFSQGLLNPRIP